MGSRKMAPALSSVFCRLQRAVLLMRLLVAFSSSIDTSVKYVGEWDCNSSQGEAQPVAYIVTIKDFRSQVTTILPHSVSAHSKTWWLPWLMDGPVKVPTSVMIPCSSEAAFFLPADSAPLLSWLLVVTGNVCSSSCILPAPSGKNSHDSCSGVFFGQK